MSASIEAICIFCAVTDPSGFGDPNTDTCTPICRSVADPDAALNICPVSESRTILLLLSRDFTVIDVASVLMISPEIGRDAVLVFAPFCGPPIRP